MSSVVASWHRLRKRPAAVIQRAPSGFGCGRARNCLPTECAGRRDLRALHEIIGLRIFGRATAPAVRTLDANGTFSFTQLASPGAIAGGRQDGS
jgi:hypothetical protein